MRTEGFAMVLIVAACLIGCGKKNPGEEFVGTWKCESVTIGPPGYEKPSSCEKTHTYSCEIRKAERGENRYDIFIKTKENDPEPTHIVGVYNRDSGILNAGDGAIVMDIDEDGALSQHITTFDSPPGDITYRKVR